MRGLLGYLNIVVMMMMMIYIFCKANFLLQNKSCMLINGFSVVDEFDFTVIYY